MNNNFKIGDVVRIKEHAVMEGEQGVIAGTMVSESATLGGFRFVYIVAFPNGVQMYYSPIYLQSL